MDLGKDMGRRPDGECKPNNISAIARPPFSPGYQASKMASTCSCSQVNDIGRPFWRTRITGVPVSTISFRNSSCFPGSVNSALSRFSPQVSVWAFAGKLQKADSCRRGGIKGAKQGRGCAYSCFLMLMLEIGLASAAIFSSVFSMCV